MKIANAYTSLFIVVYYFLGH